MSHLPQSVQWQEISVWNRSVILAHVFVLRLCQVKGIVGSFIHSSNQHLLFQPLICGEEGIGPVFRELWVIEEYTQWKWALKKPFYVVLGCSQAASFSHFQMGSEETQPHISTCPFFPNPSAYRWPHSVGRSSPRYAIGPCWFSILNMPFKEALFYIFNI